MVYLEKTKIKGNYYYKLVHTIKNGKQISHKSKYIGKNLPNPDELEIITKNFLREINSKRYKYALPEDIEKIEKKKTEYSKEIKSLSETEKEEKLKEFIIRFTYDSSKLSGVRITLRQTHLILREGIIPKGFKTLKTTREIENHEKGIIAITNYKGPLNLHFIRKLHKILLSGIDDSISGKLRSEIGRDVKIAGTPYIPPKWNLLNKELEVFFKWYKSESRRLHPLELAALIHLKIISLQPFVDGNSRLSRLLMNWILWKKNYPMIDIPIEDLEMYYDVLDLYQIEKNEKPFVKYVIKKFVEG